MRKMIWLRLFALFGSLGCLAEIVVGYLHEAVFGQLWIYYNGFYTSPESWLYFGLLGIAGFRAYLFVLNWFDYEIIKYKEDKE